MQATPTATTRAAPRMGMGISEQRARHASRLAIAFTALAVAACGSSGHAGAGAGQGSGSQDAGSQSTSGQVGGGQFSGGGPSAFAWLHPAPAPPGWRTARIASGAVLAYPREWRRQHGDPGTATAALRGPDGSFLGYLNLTPRQGAETLANWSEFRVEHNAEEGDRAVTRLSAATGLHFLTGHGSCVEDHYSTETGGHFIEIACLVAGRHAQSVVVGAASLGSWRMMSRTIERAIAAVRT